MKGDDDFPGMPRWLKVMLLVLAVLLVAALLLMHLIGGQHGPGRH